MVWDGESSVVYPVTTVWVSGVSQTAKIEVLVNDSNISARELFEEDNERIGAGSVGCYLCVQRRRY